jgi:hypothetical protein
MSELLPAATRPAVPWKNGGGTTQLLASTPGVGGVEFGWRASMAEVAVAGPFSCFPGISRLLCVLSGRLHLRVAARAPVILSPDDASYAFPGDVPAEGAPLDGPVRDFNLMFDPARWRAGIVACGTGVTPPDDAERLFLALGAARVNGLALARHDALRLPPGEGCAITAGHGLLCVLTPV